MNFKPKNVKITLSTVSNKTNYMGIYNIPPVFTFIC